MPPPDSADVLYEKRDRIALITLNRPHRGNALTQSVRTRLREVWCDVRDDPSVRCAVVTGAGDRFFCTGADVIEVAQAPPGTKMNDPRDMSAPLQEDLIFGPFHNRVWKPVIAAVNGVVAGGGLHFVAEADIVVAAEAAVFMDTHVNVGMVSAVETIGLARRLPLGAALRMALQGRNYRMPAARAYQLGLVDELVSRADLMETATSIAGDICLNSPHAIRLSKQALWYSLEAGYSAALEHGWALVKVHRHHPDFREGPLAFAEKREPTWTDAEPLA